jgi:ATP-dependent Clp protease protease subunit
MVINPIVYDEKGKGNDVFSCNLESRVIHMVGEVTDEMAASVVAQLLHLASTGEDDIYLYINSPGGSVSAGMAIYDTMQYIAPDVATVCLGRAASMGAMILSGGAKGKRMILPHGEVMIHQPSGGMSGQASELLIAAEHIKETKQMLNELLSENCGRELAQVVQDTERDHWMRAEEALEYGIVDSVLKGKKK